MGGFVLWRDAPIAAVAAVKASKTSPA